MRNIWKKKKKKKSLILYHKLCTEYLIFTILINNFQNIDYYILIMAKYNIYI